MTHLQHAVHEAEHDAREPELHDALVELLRGGWRKVVELDGVRLQA